MILLIICGSLSKDVLYVHSDRINITRHMKETITYVALDFQQEIKKAKNISSVDKGFELPDGRIFYIGDGGFQCRKVLLQPSLVGKGPTRIHENVYISIIKSDVDIRKDLFAYIMLIGGSTMFPCIVERMSKKSLLLFQGERISR